MLSRASEELWWAQEVEGRRWFTALKWQLKNSQRQERFFITQQQTRWLFNRCGEIRLASVNGGNNNDSWQIVVTAKGWWACAREVGILIEWQPIFISIVQFREKCPKLLFYHLRLIMIEKMSVEIHMVLWIIMQCVSHIINATVFKPDVFECMMYFIYLNFFTKIMSKVLLRPNNKVFKSNQFHLYSLKSQYIASMGFTVCTVNNILCP